MVIESELCTQATDRGTHARWSWCFQAVTGRGPGWDECKCQDKPDELFYMASVSLPGDLAWVECKVTPGRSEFFQRSLYTT